MSTPRPSPILPSTLLRRSTRTIFARSVAFFVGGTSLATIYRAAGVTQHESTACTPPHPRSTVVWSPWIRTRGIRHAGDSVLSERKDQLSAICAGEHKGLPVTTGSPFGLLYSEGPAFTHLDVPDLHDRKSSNSQVAAYRPNVAKSRVTATTS
jgi:hypothetical protein